MEEANEQGGLDGVPAPMPYVSGALGKRRKSCQEVVDAKGAAELVSRLRVRQVISRWVHPSIFGK